MTETTPHCIQMAFVALSLSVAAAAATASTSSTVLLEEDFESYEGEAAFEKTWPRAGNAPSGLAEDPAGTANIVLRSKGDRRTRVFAAYTPTDEQPLRVSVDYYDGYQEGAAGREYLGLWTGPFDPAALIEVGQHNHPGAEAFELFRARASGGENEWYALRTPRIQGWHKIHLLIYARTVEVYIDGDLDTILDWAGGPLGAVRLGSGFGTGEEASPTEACYDNLRIETLTISTDEGTLMELSLFNDPPDRSSSNQLAVR